MNEWKTSETKAGKSNNLFLGTETKGEVDYD